MKTKKSKKIDQRINILFLIILCFTFTKCSGDETCTSDKPIFRKSIGQCVMDYCTPGEFSNGECTIENPVIKISYTLVSPKVQFILLLEEVQMGTYALKVV